MDDRRWLDAVALFERIVELDEAEQRAEIDRAGADAPELRAEVERLLRADAAADSRGFLAESPELTGTWDAPVAASRSRDSVEHAAELPTRFGPYRVLGELGRGGMGTIYEGVRDDQTMDQRVAIKVIRSGVESDDIVRRMRAERRILARLEHPQIARIFDAGSTDDGLPYFVMERVDGMPIDRWCDEQQLDVPARLRLVRQVCAAVQYANDQLIVHRDIKPSNILVTADGVPKLLDFGIAKVLDPDPGDEPSLETEPWRQRATLDYASPEHLIGRPASLSGDVYSLGVLLFRLLTGETPRSPSGTTPWHLDRESAVTGPPRPSQVLARRQRDAASPTPTPTSDRDLDSIVLGALQGDPRRRYASAKELGDDLGRYLDGFPVVARHGSWSYRAGKFVRRHAAAVSLSGIIAILVVALLASVIRSGIEAEASRSRLSAESAKREQVLQTLLGIFEQAGPLVSEGVPLTLVDAVDRYGERAVAGLASQPDAEAAVLSALGWVYLDLGDPAKAYDLHSRALDRRQHLGRRHEHDQLDSLIGVAASLRDQWQLDEAAARSAEAMEHMARLDELTPGQRLHALNQHVKLLCFQGAWEEAEPFSEQALRWSRDVDASSAQVPIASSQRAQVLRNLGDLDAARDLYASTVDGMRGRYGDEHPVLAALYNNLAEIAFRQRDYATAVERFTEADAQYVAAYGEDFYDRVRPLNNMGRALVAAGRPEEAEVALRAAIRVALDSPALSARHERRYFGVPATVLADLLIASDRCPEVVELFADRVAGWKDGKTTTKAREQLQRCRASEGDG